MSIQIARIVLFSAVGIVVVPISRFMTNFSSVLLEQDSRAKQLSRANRELENQLKQYVPYSWSVLMLNPQVSTY